MEVEFISMRALAGRPNPLGSIGEREEHELAYQVESCDSTWNEIRIGTGAPLYWANKSTRQIYRVVDGYVGGPINLFRGRT